MIDIHKFRTCCNNVIKIIHNLATKTKTNLPQPKKIFFRFFDFFNVFGAILDLGPLL